MAEQESPLEESKMDEEDMDMEDTPAVDDRELPKVEAPKDEEARVDDNDHDVEDQPRPAKRARKSSNADEESMISVSIVLLLERANYNAAQRIPPTARPHQTAYYHLKNNRQRHLHRHPPPEPR